MQVIPPTPSPSLLTLVNGCGSGVAAGPQGPLNIFYFALCVPTQTGQDILLYFPAHIFPLFGWEQIKDETARSLR